MKLFFLLAFYFSAMFSCFAMTCIKPSHKVAVMQVIYLHGMDTSLPSAQELEIRKSLKNLSNELAVSFALPRAFEKGPESKSQFCWMWGAEKKEDIKLKRDKILKKAKSCFNKPLTSLWLGFSNGGNFVSQIFQECAEEGKYITFGASGGNVKDSKTSLKGCGQYKALIGKKDKWNYAHATKFYAKLKSRNGHIDVLEFNGGHEVNIDLLREVLKGYIK